MEYLDTPVGKVRIPDSFSHASFTDNITFSWAGGGVELLFWRADTDLDGRLEKDKDGAIGEVVARVFVTDQRFANLPETIQAAINLHAFSQDNQPPEPA